MKDQETTLGRMALSPARRLGFLVALAALLCAVAIAYVLATGGEARAHDCGHTQYHENHVVNGTHVKGNHDHTLSLPNHPHEHDERDVIYTDHSWTNGVFYQWHADGWHLHCLITKVGGM